MVNLSELTAKRNSNISSVKITITHNPSQSASKAIPWIGLLGGYGSPFINGGYAGGVLSVNSIRLPHADYGFTCLEDKQFKGFSIAPADGWKEVLCYTIYTIGGTNGMTKLKYRCENADLELSFEVRNSTNKQLYIHSTKIRNIKVKVEVYASTINANYVKTVKIYAKAYKSGMPTLYFEPAVFSTPYAAFFVDKASALNFATEEMGYMESGSTAERPIAFTSGYNISQPGDLTAADVGFRYFDTDLGMPIFAKTISGGSITWVKSDGTTV